MDKLQAPVSVDQSKCAPCGGLICAGVCPVGILEPRADGKPIVVDVAACTGCGVCADLCRLGAISVNHRKSKR